MSGSDSSSSSGGIGFLGALALLFIALKLTGYIDWSWWWVTAPLWAGAALVLLIIGGFFGFMAWEDRAVERKRRLRQNRSER